MPYVLSRKPNSQAYSDTIKGTDDPSQLAYSILIKGGADVTNKALEIPNGVITQVTKEELELLKGNREFQNHLERNFVNYFDNSPNLDKEADKLSKDKSAQITESDYRKKKKKAPATESIL